eukprot:3050702-Alexandrium_andersonii.AAC.1
MQSLTHACTRTCEPVPQQLAHTPMLLAGSIGDLALAHTEVHESPTQALPTLTPGATHPGAHTE